MIDQNRAMNIAGLLILLSGTVFIILFGRSLQFDPNPTVWFTPAYYLQFIPIYIAVIFFICGFFLVIKFRKVNVYLAVFGHATSEEIIFSIVGLTVTPLPTYAMAIFLPLSIIALWIAYRNTLDRETVSLAEAIFGIVLSTASILIPRYL